MARKEDLYNKIQQLNDEVVALRAANKKLKQKHETLITAMKTIKNQQLGSLAKRPNHVANLLAIFASQMPDERNWPAIMPEVDNDKPNEITIRLPNDEVGFVFDAKTKRLKGIYNWKD